MTTIGVRELRESAHSLVLRAGAGEVFTIAVAGVPRARLLPLEKPAWRVWDEVADVLMGAPDPTWASDMAAIDGVIVAAD